MVLPWFSPWFPRGHGPLGRHQHLRTQRRRARPHGRGAGADPQGAVRRWAPIGWDLRGNPMGKRGLEHGKLDDDMMDDGIGWWDYNECGWMMELDDMMM